VDSTSDRSDSFPYPGGSVIGAVIDDAAMDAARRGLEQAGFDAAAYEVLHGEAGLARLDVEGEAHGRKGGLMRRLQSVLSDDGDDVRRYAEHLRDGHYVVGVRVGEDEVARQRAADVLRAAHAESLNYYADTYVEDLGTGR
jgi:hypothetical protein